MYLRVINYQIIPSVLKAIAIFTNLIRMDGHATARLLTRKEIWHLTIPLDRFCQYVFAYQKLSKCSRALKKLKAISKSLLLSDGHASTRLFTLKSGIRQFHWLGLVNIYLNATDYQKIQSGFKV